MRARRTDAAAWGLAAALLLMVAAMAIPAAFDWYVHVHSVPPLHAEWAPRVGWGTAPALLVAWAVLTRGPHWLADSSWRRLLLTCYLTGVAWLLALAYVDGHDGVGGILDTGYEYLDTARSTTDIPATLREYVSRIPFSAGDRHWPVHIAGHPPGALLFFVVLVRLGLGSGYAAGLVVLLVAASTPLAVLTTLRTLGAGDLGRRAAPFLVFGPAAVWQAVSADAMFAAVGAWGMAALARATMHRSIGWSGVLWSGVAGVLLGYTVMLSYGLPLLGVLAVTILWLARTWWPLPVAAAAASLVVLAFAAFGFSYWEAFPVLQDRYWDGVASRRQPEYWMWGNLAALMFSAGPLAGAGLAHLARHRPRPEPVRVVAALGAAGWGMVLLADLSQMSRAEVERIWLPFVPWVLLPCALLPQPWRRAGLGVQLVTALIVQHLLFTGW